MAAERDEDARQAWRAAMAERDAHQFVFLDEVGANVTLTPRNA